jgi:vacuolar protein 8
MAHRLRLDDVLMMVSCVCRVQAPLVCLLRTGSLGAQETSAGALLWLAESQTNRVSIADAGAIPLLVSLLDGGSEEVKEQAAGALQMLVKNNLSNQKDIAEGLVELLATGSASAQEHVTQLLKNLARDPENRASIAKAGAVPELVRQLERGSPKAMGMAAQGLALIALRSAEFRSVVTQERSPERSPECIRLLLISDRS